jgi:hypothetical protein
MPSIAEISSRIDRLERELKRLNDPVVCIHVRCELCESFEAQRKIRMADIASRIAALTDLMTNP